MHGTQCFDANSFRPLSSWPQRTITVEMPICEAKVRDCPVEMDIDLRKVGESDTWRGGGWGSSCLQ